MEENVKLLSKELLVLPGETIKEALEEKYNPDNIFKKKNEQNDGNNEKNENLQLIEYKDKNFIQRFLSKIRKLFKRN